VDSKESQKIIKSGTERKISLDLEPIVIGTPVVRMAIQENTPEDNVKNQIAL
jgi:hypothetical protein